MKQLRVICKRMKTLKIWTKMISSTKMSQTKENTKVDYQLSGNREEENKLSSNLLFLIQELGSMKKSEDGKEVYIPGPTCEKGIKDMVKYCKCSLE